MKVQDHINALPRTVIHDAGNNVLIVGLIGALASEPVVLIQGKADDRGMPSCHGHLRDREGIPAVPARRAFPGAGEFQTIHIHTLEGDGTTTGSL
jgi:hypothetical protein